MGLTICLFVSQSVAKMQKLDFLKKTKQFRATVSIDDLWQVVHELFKQPIIRPLKSKMAEIGHLENRHDVIVFAVSGPILINFVGWCRMTCRLR